MVRVPFPVDFAVTLLAVGVASLVGAPPAAGSPAPSSGTSAQATIDDLRAAGYDVQINWTTGYDTKPLSDCWVTGVNDPTHGAPVAAGTFTTVYVDVACPNGDDGPSFGVGVGLG